MVAIGLLFLAVIILMNYWIFKKKYVSEGVMIVSFNVFLPFSSFLKY